MYMCYNLTDSTGLCWLLKPKLIDGIKRFFIIVVEIEIYRRNNKGYYYSLINKSCCSPTLRAQVKQTFQDAVKTHANADTMIGVKGGSHIWQPVDHHIGREYHRRMQTYYVEWMASPAYNVYAENDRSVPVDVRCILLTKWAARCWRELEEERKAREEVVRLDPSAEPSRFFKAFRSTGCLITRDGTGDEHINPHSEIKGELKDQMQMGIKTPARLQEEEDKRAHPESFVICPAGSFV
jgi:hypothetical protein